MSPQNVITASCFSVNNHPSRISGLEIRDSTWPYFLTLSSSAENAKLNNTSALSLGGRRRTRGIGKPKGLGLTALACFSILPKVVLLGCTFSSAPSFVPMETANLVIGRRVAVTPYSSRAAHRFCYFALNIGTTLMAAFLAY